MGTSFRSDADWPVERLREPLIDASRGAVAAEKTLRSYGPRRISRGKSDMAAGFFHDSIGGRRKSARWEVALNRHVRKHRAAARRNG